MILRYADLKANDIANGDGGVVVSLWVQGCPIHCEGCHNESIWDFNGGNEADTSKLIDEIILLIDKNGVKRDFSILGGEPLCEEHFEQVSIICSKIRELRPDIKIFIWTGYTIESLKVKYGDKFNDFLQNITYLIDGPFLLDKRDLRLKMRGSPNQRILKKGLDF